MFKLITASAGFLVSLSTMVLLGGAHAASIRGTQRRQLEEETPLVRNFVPLGCNKDLDRALCSPWSSFFGTEATHDTKLTIECGQCFYMDLAGELVLKQGIDIQGKLIFPHSSTSLPLLVKTPFIYVQGELEIDARNKPVDGNYLYKFEMIGANDFYLDPIHENINACIGDACKVGRKVIAIAGGRVNGKSVLLLLLLLRCLHSSQLPRLPIALRPRRRLMTRDRDLCHSGSHRVIVPRHNVRPRSASIDRVRLKSSSLFFDFLVLFLHCSVLFFSTVHGIPTGTPSWLHLYDAFSSTPNTDLAAIDTLVVQNSVKYKWAPGAELLITSHTQEWNQHQVKTIQSITDSPSQPGYVEIKLDSFIPLPTTLKESSKYAVEVALLSRNIVFEGGPDSDYTRGGQLVVFHTPFVAQILEGVEIKNFGQQGYLGRYPIHFHFSGDVTGTSVTKNTIRQSNQRCIVVHGTDNMLIQENVAFDTKGHCFLLEDGIEMGNQFIKNLGALTGPPQKVIPNMGSNGQESDKKASTFWITNPSNIFIGNVAAGSSDSGFWFELKLRGDRAHWYDKDFDPRTFKLITFKDNVAHSNDKIGLRFYPSGYRPSEIALVEGFKAYRNTRGVFLHLSKNIRFVRGLFADNGSGLEIDRADNIDILHSKFVGVSQSFKDLMKRQQGVRNVCRQGHVIGLEHHTWKNDPSIDGSFMINLRFTGFTDTGCNNAYAIHVDDRIQTPLFDLYSSFQAISFEKDADKISFCDANAVNVTAFYTDLDGSFSSKLNPVRKPSTIMSNVPSMLQFVDKTKCFTDEENCYSYCEDTCFRGIRYHVDPAGTEDYLLKVCSKDQPRSCVEFPGYFRGRDPTTSSRHRMFNAYLPAGKKYTAVFVDQNGDQVWPSYVNEHYQMDEICPNALDVGDVELIVPPVQEKDCLQLIQNPSVVVGSHSPWLHRFGGIKVAYKEGMNGSNALTSLDSASSNMIVQYVDNRCMELMKGRTYELKAWVKIKNKRTGRVYKCNSALEKCPEAGIEGIWGRTSFAYLDTDARTKDGFQLIKGSLQVGEGLATGDKVGIFLRSNIGQPLSWFIDEVTLTLVQSDD